MTTPHLPSVAVAKTSPRQVDAVIIGVGATGLRSVPDTLGRAFLERYAVPVAEMGATLGATAKAGSSVVLPGPLEGPRLVLVGLGDRTAPTPEDLRQAAGTGVRQAAALAGDAPVSVVVSLGTEQADELQAAAEGAVLGSYRYAPISGQATPEAGVGSVTVLHAGSAREATAVTAAALAVAQAVLTAREWVNVPANLLFPESFAEQVRLLLATSKVNVEVLDERALSKGGYGGLLAVGGGSARPPRLVRLSYRPRGARSHLALVGKGITFDTGGLNLKPGEGMYTMKCDMAGAAAVFAATSAIAQLGLKVSVTAYGPLAENMPSGSAYRPSDVLTMYGGKTVENGNSDAEGRLVMADALARANEDRPDLVVDVATLTGACIVALGDRTAGVMATDDATAAQLLQAAATAGEQLWQLPLPPETRGKMDSKVADLKSTGSDRHGGALIAGAFLREFVAEGTPWAHLDIAGPAFFDGSPYGYVSPGGTGFGVRTLIALAASLAG